MKHGIMNMKMNGKAFFASSVRHGGSQSIQAEKKSVNTANICLCVLVQAREDNNKSCAFFSFSIKCCQPLNMPCAVRSDSVANSKKKKNFLERSEKTQ